ncbi:MAG: hypothetical protein PHS41_10780 [Victivallaceae bacterium]|nr:hypothetical protein [Victivallaceae bacterium]
MKWSDYGFPDPGMVPFSTGVKGLYHAYNERRAIVNSYPSVIWGDNGEVLNYGGRYMTETGVGWSGVWSFFYADPTFCNTLGVGGVDNMHQFDWLLSTLCGCYANPALGIDEYQTGSTYQSVWTFDDLIAKAAEVSGDPVVPSAVQGTNYLHDDKLRLTPVFSRKWAKARYHALNLLRYLPRLYKDHGPMSISDLVELWELYDASGDYELYDAQE